MKGTMIVPKLKRSGKYVSELDYSFGFGWFKMYLEPFDDGEEGLIKYKKLSSGYEVEGEAYILWGKTEEEIDKKVRKYKYASSFSKVVHQQIPND